MQLRNSIAVESERGQLCPKKLLLFDDHLRKYLPALWELLRNLCHILCSAQIPLSDAVYDCLNAQSIKAALFTSQLTHNFRACTYKLAQIFGVSVGSSDDGERIFRICGDEVREFQRIFVVGFLSE